MQNQIILHGSQRVDKPDFDRLFQYIDAEFSISKKEAISDLGVIFEGFRFYIGTGLEALMDRNVPRVGLDTDGLFFADTDLSAVPLSIAIEDEATNYIQVKFETEDTDLQDRSFWNLDEQQEYVDNVTTRKHLIATIISSTAGYQSGYMPLYRFVTTGGAISNVYDDRNLIFAPSRRTYSWPSPKSDEDIQDQRDFNDAIADQIRRIIGLTYWYQNPSASLEDIWGIVNTPIYEEAYVPTSDVAKNTIIPLPVDSRTSDPEYYVINARELLVLVNGRKLTKDPIDASVADTSTEYPGTGLPAAVAGQRYFIETQISAFDANWGGNNDLLPQYSVITYNGTKWILATDPKDYIEYSDGSHPTNPDLGTGIRILRDYQGGYVRNVAVSEFSFRKNNGGGAIYSFELDNCVAVQDEGSTILGQSKILNFIGAGVQVTQNGTDKVDILISSGGGGGASFTRTKINGTASTIQPFSAVCLMADASRVQPTDANELSKVIFYGIALEAINPGQSGSIQFGGLVSNGAFGKGWAQQGRLWLGENPGEIIESDSLPITGAFAVEIGIIDGNDVIIRPQQPIDLGGTSP